MCIRDRGKQILKLIGKEPGAKGIILPTEMMAAIDALQAAVKQEEQAHQDAIEAAQAQATSDGAPHTIDGTRAIGLKQRVVPFIDMLRRAHAEDKEVVWGV
jgi:hypothetical protein